MASPSGTVDNIDPWASAVIPAWTRADDGTRTPCGEPAIFRSSTHAWIALRLVYLAEVIGQSDAEIRVRAVSYRQQFDRYRQHLDDMRVITALIVDDLPAAGERWNGIDQRAANAAFTTMLCEQEAFPAVNIATLAYRHFGLGFASPVPVDRRDRRITPRDHEDAWAVSANGNCKSCGNPTISPREHKKLRQVMRANPDLFDLKPTYVQRSGAIAPLWSSRLLIAAKGVADHIEPWSRGGRTAPDNLANVCAACNYSRNDVSLDILRVAAYT